MNSDRDYQKVAPTTDRIIFQKECLFTNKATSIFKNRHLPMTRLFYTFLFY